MDENVLAAIGRLNEAEALLAIVELHGSGVHMCLSRVEISSRGEGAARPVATIWNKIWRVENL
jgi:hypothetical protein